MGQKLIKLEERPSGAIIPIKEGAIQCDAPNQTAYFFDNASCFFFQLPYFLDKIGFGYISTFTVLVVAVIAGSKSKKCPQNLYIFNILLIDLCVCYGFLSNRAIDNNGFQNCYVGFNRFIAYNTHLVNKLPPIGLFLFAKFKCFSEKEATKFGTTIFVITIFDTFIFAIFLFTNYIIQGKCDVSNYTDPRPYGCETYSVNQTKPFTFSNITCTNNNETDLAACAYLWQQSLEECYKNAEEIWSTIAAWTRFERIVWFTVLFLASTFILLFMAKIGNRKFLKTSTISDRKENMRIMIFLLIHAVLLIIQFALDYFKEPDVSFSASFKALQPLWLKWLTQKGGANRSIRELRVVITSLIILFIIPGYKTALNNGIFWLFLILSKLTIKAKTKFTNYKIVTVVFFQKIMIKPA